MCPDFDTADASRASGIVFISEALPRQTATGVRDVGRAANHRLLNTTEGCGQKASFEAPAPELPLDGAFRPEHRSLDAIAKPTYTPWGYMRLVEVWIDQGG